MNHEKLANEFDRQIETLIRLGYPKIARVKRVDFVREIEPLKKKIGKDFKGGRIPFVIVVKSDWVAIEKALPLVELDSKKAFIALYPVEPKNFQPIDTVKLPIGLAYLIGDVDTGQATLNVTPNQAIEKIKRQKRSPLTIDEGVALLTHYPEVLKANNCFYMLGSRSGDKRVAALWISRGKPRLGWCWAGNPHSWLGSASCLGRIGL